MKTPMIRTGQDYIASLRGRQLEVWLFGERPKVVPHPQNILVFVRNCACTSTPITTS